MESTKTGKWRQLFEDALRELVHTDVSKSELAAYYGVSLDTLSKWVKTFSPSNIAAVYHKKHSRKIKGLDALFLIFSLGNRDRTLCPESPSKKAVIASLEGCDQESLSRSVINGWNADLMETLVSLVSVAKSSGSFLKSTSGEIDYKPSSEDKERLYKSFDKLPPNMYSDLIHAKGWQALALFMVPRGTSEEFPGVRKLADFWEVKMPLVLEALENDESLSEYSPMGKMLLLLMHLPFLLIQAKY